MNICLCTPSEKPYSETFIQAHIDRLPGPPMVMRGTRPFRFTKARHPWLYQVERGMLSVGSRLGAESKSASRLTRRWQERSVADILRASGCDVVLAEYGDTAVDIQGACAAAQKPLVVHFHGHDAHREPTLEACGHYRELVGQAAGIVVVSKVMEQKLVSLGAAAGKVHRSPYGVDLQRFEVTSPEQNGAHFVAVGRFVEKKAPHLTVAAFATVLKSCPEATLAMIGDGPLLNSCMQLAKGLGVDSRIRFCGSLGHEEVAGEMRRARCFVQHSVTARDGDSEGMPVAILEAGATGLPVIATRHAGIPESVLHGETGFLVDEFDVDGMAGHMVEVARDPALAKQLGLGARSRIGSEFSMEKSILRLTEILQQSI